MLGVGADAGRAEIEAAYRRLMLRAHPDHGGAPASRRSSTRRATAARAEVSVYSGPTTRRAGLWPGPRRRPAAPSAGEAGEDGAIAAAARGPPGLRDRRTAPRRRRRCSRPGAWQGVPAEIADLDRPVARLGDLRGRSRPERWPRSRRAALPGLHHQWREAAVGSRPRARSVTGVPRVGARSAPCRSGRRRHRLAALGGGDVTEPPWRLLEQVLGQR